MIYRFFHFFGFALWMGGAFVTMALVIRARKEDPPVRAALFRLLPAANAVINIGASLTFLTGLVLAMMLARLGVMASRPGVHLMMTVGLIAWLIGLFVSRPAVRKLAALSVAHPAGDFPPDFEKVRKRMAMASSISGVLVLLALVGATLI